MDSLNTPWEKEMTEEKDSKTASGKSKKDKKTSKRKKCVLV